MSIYNKILVALDVSSEAELVIEKASEIADKFSAELFIIHVVEPVIADSTYDLLPPIDPNIENQLVERSKLFLTEILKKNGLEKNELLIPIGSTKTEIHNAAKAKDVDLIVIGTHGRHGVAMLLGSTANAILHGASCDILSVKIPPD